MNLSDISSDQCQNHASPNTKQFNTPRTPRNPGELVYQAGVANAEIDGAAQHQVGRASSPLEDDREAEEYD